MPRRQRHFVWELYLALAHEGGRTEQAGRDAIKALIPSQSNLVDAVIAVQGHTDKLEAAMVQQWSEAAETEETALEGEAMNGRIREGLTRAKDHQGPVTVEGETGEAEAKQDDFTQTLRERAERNRIDPETADVNTALRQAAGRG